jgi:hypothetical protein
MRITRKQLQSVVDRINAITNSPSEPYTRQEDGSLKENKGCFFLSGAYGGWCIYRDGSQVIWSGHIPLRDAYEQAHAFIRGLTFNSAQ